MLTSIPRPHPAWAHAGGAAISPAGARIALFIGAICVIDPVINQINTAFRPMIGSLSLLQAMRGALFGILLVVAAIVPNRAGKMATTVSRILFISFFCLLVLVITGDAITNGEVNIPSMVAYIQIAYWLLIWYIAVVSIFDDRCALFILKGLVVGAIITASSILYAYVSGVHNEVYRAGGVEASSGWFVSGKGVAGTLVAGAMVAAYLGFRHGRRATILISLLFITASFLTYARAGMVSLGVSLVWLVIWSTGARSHARSSWARRLILTTICCGAILAVAAGTDELVLRWADLGDSNRAGSGRLVIWKAAISIFLAGTSPEKSLGFGIDGTTAQIAAVVGIPIHTHNDLLDMLLIGGLFGVMILFLVVMAIVIQIRAASLDTPEAAVAVSIMLVLFCQGFFTGQLFMPEVMAYYLLAITAVMACAKKRPNAGPHFMANGYSALQRRMVSNDPIRTAH